MTEPNPDLMVEALATIKDGLRAFYVCQVCLSEVKAQTRQQAQQVLVNHLWLAHAIRLTGDPFNLENYVR